MCEYWTFYLIKRELLMVTFHKIEHWLWAHLQRSLQELLWGQYFVCTLNGRVLTVSIGSYQPRHHNHDLEWPYSVTTKPQCTKWGRFAPQCGPCKEKERVHKRVKPYTFFLLLGHEPGGAHNTHICLYFFIPSLSRTL